MAVRVHIPGGAASMFLDTRDGPSWVYVIGAGFVYDCPRESVLRRLVEAREAQAKRKAGA